MNAPVALFAFNRPRHTARALEALAANNVASDTDLFVFCDGPRDDEERDAVLEVRRVVAAVQTGFRSVTVAHSDVNRGLATSVFAGVGQLLKSHGRVICVEDDLVTSPYFLEYMDNGLRRYADDRRIFSVCGYKYRGALPADYVNDAFLFRRFCSWGWATWADRWTDIELTHERLDGIREDPVRRERVVEGGRDLLGMASAQLRGEIDSWAIQAAIASADSDRYSVYPRESLVSNIGMDGSGVHSGVSDRWDVPIDRRIRPILDDALQPDAQVASIMLANW